MLFDLTFPCYLTSLSGKKCLSGKVICAFFMSRLSKFSCKGKTGVKLEEKIEKRIKELQGK
jgi:hypothetical protein